MSNSNTILDKTYCDILIEVKGIEKYHMFDLNNMDTITEIGFHHAAMKMNEKNSWRIVEKCHKHYEMTEKIQRKLESIKKKK